MTQILKHYYATKEFMVCRYKRKLPIPEIARTLYLHNYGKNDYFAKFFFSRQILKIIKNHLEGCS